MIVIVRNHEVEWNLKITARVNVKAGVRLLIAEERVGELCSTPLNPTICAMHLFLFSQQTRTQKPETSINIDAGAILFTRKAQVRTS